MTKDPDLEYHEKICTERYDRIWSAIGRSEKTMEEMGKQMSELSKTTIELTKDIRSLTKTYESNSRRTMWMVGAMIGTPSMLLCTLQIFKIMSGG